VARKRNRTQAERRREVKRLNIVCGESDERRRVGQVGRPIFRYSSRDGLAIVAPCSSGFVIM
jgi:hypothetical protein